MASNTATRLMTGIPLAAVVMAMCFYANSHLVVGVSYVALILAWREFLRLVIPSRVPRLFTVGGGVILSVLYLLGNYLPDYFMVALSIAVGLMFLFNIRDYMAALRGGTLSEERFQTLIPLIAAPMGLMYVLSLVLYVPKIHFLPDGGKLLACFLGGVWGCDTGAYFAGKYLGSKPLAPSISPKKTWEGLGGGTLVTLLWLLFCQNQIDQRLTPIDVALLTLVLAPLSQLGDLAESLLKRSVQKKDAGSLIPGHGGILDRLDGYLLSCPLFYLYAALRFQGGLV